ncbi:MAG: TetR/AcrR family transcriptional regulator [Thermoleophilia bacterium]
MPRTPDPDVRTRLVERAAEALVLGRPTTLRALAESAGTSTMAVYTHFGGMDGLWDAVRAEGFARLHARLARLRPTDDPVRDLTATGTAYVLNALANPHLYARMFDGRGGAPPPPEAATAFDVLVDATRRAVEAGRFDAGTDARGAALELWAMTHGLVSLVITGALGPEDLVAHLPRMSVAAFTGLGDERARAEASVAAAAVTLRQARTALRGGQSSQSS